MTTALDQLVRAAFGGIQFPIRKCAVKGGLRDHVHEYPKSPGGAPEKLGRKLYTISMEAPFFDVFPTYDELYPTALGTLFGMFEEETTDALVVPSVGTIQAYCVNWSRDLEAKVRSGEVAQFEFREDQSSAFLVENIINIQARDLTTVASQMQSETDAAGVSDLFSGVQNAIGQVTGLVDQVELYGSLAQAKILGIVGAFDELDRTVDALSDPANYALLEAFLSTWQAANDLNDNMLKQRSPIVSYVVPKTMAVSDISRALYGDASHSIDILSLNPIEDAFSVLGGTKLKVFAPSAVKAA